ALVTAGPGHLNALSALYGALMAESPLVLLSGHAPVAQAGRRALPGKDPAGGGAPRGPNPWGAPGAAPPRGGHAARPPPARPLPTPRGEEGAARAQAPPPATP